MNRNLSNLLLLVVACAHLALITTGCVGLRQVSDSTRFYVLSALPVRTATNVSTVSNLPVGLGSVKLPSYLLDQRVSIRRGPNEIEYAEYHLWAERLDKGIERVLASNLSTLLGPDRSVLSAWQRDEVAAEVYVTIQQFECDIAGRVVLLATWRILSPGGVAVGDVNRAHIERQGASFVSNPEKAIEAMSAALADFSGEIANTLRSPR